MKEETAKGLVMVAVMTYHNLKKLEGRVEKLDAELNDIVAQIPPEHMDDYVRQTTSLI